MEQKQINTNVKDVSKEIISNYEDFKQQDIPAEGLPI